MPVRPEDFGAVKVGPDPSQFGATRVTPAAATAEKPSEGFSLSGLAEPGWAMASSIFGQSIGGLTGLAAAALPGPAGQGADVAQRVSRALTYEPRTKTGQDIMKIAGLPGEAVTAAAKAVGKRGAEVSPMLGTIGETSVQALPMLLGARAGMKGAPKLTQEQAEAAAARDVGMKLTPEEMKAGAVPKALSSIAGEPSLARSVSAKNQALWKRMMADDLGIRRGDVIDRETLDNIRSDEGNAYATLRKTGTLEPDAQFHADLDETIKDLEGSAKSFEHRQEAPLRTIVDSLKKPTTIDANAAVSEIENLRKDAKKAYAQKDNELGKGAISAASALEDLLDRHVAKLASMGQIEPGALEKFKAARVRIAKSYAADKALNPVTGEINPQEYAKMLKKRVPLTGPAKQMGELAESFPRSAQRPTHIPTGPGYGDLLMALLRSKGGALVKELPYMFARPAVRAGLSSGVGQALMDPRTNLRLQEALGISSIPQAQPVPPAMPVPATPAPQNENVPITSVRG